MEPRSTDRQTDWVSYRPTQLAPVELMHAHFVQHSFERHSHETFAIGVTASGVQSFRCRGAELNSVSGNIVAFNPDEPHDGHRGSDEAFAYTMLYIDPSWVYGLLKDGRGQARNHLRRPLITDPAAGHALRRAASALEQDGESLRADALLAGALLQLFSRHGDAGDASVEDLHSPAWLSRARDYIHAHFAENISGEELAGVVQVSRVHLSRSFAAAYGMPPHVYLNSVRVNAAKRLLLAGLPLADVAVATGFADQSHLTRRFKGHTGMTPAAWCRQMRQPVRAG
jgi:AraC-like DNA-binding protein